MLYSDAAALALFKEYSMVLVIFYAFPGVWCRITLTSVQKLIGHSAISSEESSVLASIISVNHKQLWLMILFYFSSGILTVTYKLTTSLLKDELFSYWLAVTCSVMLTMSALSLFRLRRLDLEASELLSEFAIREKQKKEQEAAKARALEAYKDLTSTENGFKPEDLEKFKNAKKVINPGQQF